MLEHLATALPSDVVDPSDDVAIEGELFAEAEFDQEQETYMNEEALLEQVGLGVELLMIVNYRKYETGHIRIFISYISYQHAKTVER